MRDELDKILVEKYPKIFRDRYAPAWQSAMCWGFEHGDGWFQIIDSLCGQIQNHIDFTRKRRLSTLRYNRALRQAIRGDDSALVKYFTYGENPTDWTYQQVDEIMSVPEPEYRIVPQACPQVVASQIKEKFGGLRFYHYGGDDVVDGMVRMAESWAANTCETCGKPGKARRGGWIRTLCDEHAGERPDVEVSNF